MFKQAFVDARGLQDESTVTHKNKETLCGCWILP